MLPTIAVNDSGEWLHGSAMGDGRAQKGKTHFQKHTCFLFINLNAPWPAVAFMELEALSKCFQIQSFLKAWRHHRDRTKRFKQVVNVVNC